MLRAMNSCPDSLVQKQRLLAREHIPSFLFPMSHEELAAWVDTGILEWLSTDSNSTSVVGPGSFPVILLLIQGLVQSPKAVGNGAMWLVAATPN